MSAVSDVKRELIGRVELGKTKSGKVVANLYSTDTRLEFPAMQLFDLSMLETVGIDPNTLDQDPIHRRFWAYYTESEKTTSKGNPYRDCQYLELVKNGNSEPKTNSGTILAEVRAIRALLEILVSQRGSEVPRVVLGADDENAEWIADAETRAEEQAIHDELEAMHAAAQNGKTEAGVPMGSQALVEWLNARADNPKTCDGVGHLIYVMKKQFGNSWEWPTGTDQDGWTQAARGWYEYWKALS